MKKNMFFALVTVSACASAGGIVYVSPHAGAVRDGSQARPFATPQEARDALRARKAKDPGASWSVELAAGEYPLAEAFTLKPEDSGTPDAPVTWRGPADGSARIVGARELKGWRVRPDGRWETDVPIVQKHRFQVAVWFEQLYVNGRRAKRARYPNEGFLQAKGAKPTLLAGDTELMELFANGGDLAPLAACSFAHLRLAHLVVHHKWSSTRRPIRGYDAARGVVFTEGKSGRVAVRRRREEGRLHSASGRDAGDDALPVSGAGARHAPAHRGRSRKRDVCPRHRFREHRLRVVRLAAPPMFQGP